MDSERLFYHTRLIPKEYLNLDTPMGKTVVINKLCDTAEPYVLDVMKDYGIDMVETRLVWWGLEKEKGVYDFSRLEDEIEKIKKAGMKVGLFAWLQHPPEWFVENEDYTHLTCIEHNEKSRLISLWDERLIEIYDRLYSVIAEKIGEKIDYWYIGVYGDYGELFFPNAVRHYRFLSEHNHTGLWCGDEKARKSYEKFLRNKYKTEENLNKSWKTENVKFENTMYFAENDSLNKKLDFRAWYCGSMSDFTDKVCAIARKHFPNIKMALPIGHTYEPLEIGQIKSHASKIAAKYNITARWTGWAYFGDFEMTNICARRVASAAKFCGTDFAVEAALYLEGDTASHAIFEALSNSAVLLHNDPGNIMRGMEVYKEFKNLDKPPLYECKTAVFYPIEAEQCGVIDIEKFWGEIAVLRRSFDYEIADSYMIEDGFLDNIETLVFASNTPLTSAVAEVIMKHVNEKGLKLFCTDGNMPYIMDGESKKTLPCEILGKEITENTKRIYRTEFPDYTLVFNAEENKITAEKNI